jgi:hypothetical protein
MIANLPKSLLQTPWAFAVQANNHTFLGYGCPSKWVVTKGKV